jgi:hypothetical protein
MHVRRKKIINNNLYEGEFLLIGSNKIDLPDGFGKMIYDNGDVYEGEWANGIRTGKGKMIYECGRVYEGEYKNNLKHGCGKLIYSNGQVYEGEFENNFMCGIGSMLFKNGDKYIGKFKDGYMHGDGILSNIDFVYTGDFLFNIMEGFGMITYANGDFYEGEFIGNKAYGSGKLWTKNIVLEGDFYQGVLNSRGIETVLNKYVYIGNFTESLKHGIGFIKYANGDKYIGNFAYGYQDGIGKFEYNCGKRIYGLWKSGFLEGMCILVYGCGDVYKGEFRNEKKYGFGIFHILEKNQKYLQFWNDDKLIDSIRINNNIKNTENFLDIYVLNEEDLSEEEKEKIICPISQEYICVPISTSCGHIFCKINLKNIILNKCPMCRQNIEYYSDNDEIKTILNKCKFGVKIKDENIEIDLNEIINVKIFLNTYKKIKTDGSNDSLVDMFGIL